MRRFVSRCCKTCLAVAPHASLVSLLLVHVSKTSLGALCTLSRCARSGSNRQQRRRDTCPGRYHACKDQWRGGSKRETGIGIRRNVPALRSCSAARRRNVRQGKPPRDNDLPDGSALAACEATTMARLVKPVLVRASVQGRVCQSIEDAACRRRGRPRHAWPTMRHDGIDHQLHSCCRLLTGVLLFTQKLQ